MSENHEHDLVWVTSPGEEQARQYCGECGYRSEWQDLPPELVQLPQLLEEGTD